jgi:hypothetical protein
LYYTDVNSSQWVNTTNAISMGGSSTLAAPADEEPIVTSLVNAVKELEARLARLEANASA